MIVENEVLDEKPSYKSSKKIILGAWYSPDLVDELWVWYKEAGFNEITVFPTNEESENYIHKSLEYCNKYKINAHLLMNNNLTIFNKKWAEIIKGYEDVVTGFDVYDEPIGDKNYTTLVRPDISDLKACIDLVLTDFPEKQFTVTLWPNYACAEQIAMGVGKTYRDYIEKYCETILSPLPKGIKRWLGTDFYPYYTNRFNCKILNNLEVLQYYAKKYKADVYLYIQTMDSKALNWRYPNKRELSLQYYIALAYGVKNIQVFCYQEPQRLSGGEFGFLDGQAMITDGYTPRRNVNGELMPREYVRTSIYYNVKEINEHLSNLSEAYMNFEWQGVMIIKGKLNCARDDFSDLEYSLKSFEGIKSVNSDENLLIGCFCDKKGNFGYMITNYSDPLDLKDAFIEIDFGKNEKAFIYSKSTNCCVKLMNGVFKIKLEGGNGVFVIPQKFL